MTGRLVFHWRGLGPGLERRLCSLESLCKQLVTHHGEQNRDGIDALHLLGAAGGHNFETAQSALRKKLAQHPAWLHFVCLVSPNAILNQLGPPRRDFQ
mgnify:CR=1 FL=1